MTFDISKCKKNEQGHWIAETRDGRKVRIVCADCKGATGQLLGLITHPDGNEKAVRWYSNGNYYLEGSGYESDLINPPTKHEAVVEVWRIEGRHYATLASEKCPRPAESRKVHEQKIEWSE